MSAAGTVQGLSATGYPLQVGVCALGVPGLELILNLMGYPDLGTGTLHLRVPDCGVSALCHRGSVPQGWWLCPMGQRLCAPCPLKLCPCTIAGNPVSSLPRHHSCLLCAADNPSLLTIQPDLSTTTMTYQGSLCPRQDGPAKLQLPNGHLLSPLGAGRHTLHHSSPAAEGADFVARLSTQSYFRSLPRGTNNMAYGTFNFLGGRLMIPNTGTAGWGFPSTAQARQGLHGAHPLPAPQFPPRDQPAHPTRCHPTGEDL